MQSKPFSIQAPEEVAKAYGGDKQKIMQAAQMGIVDPTAALLAGMFIDRMRAPQAAEGANPPTVAQQVFNPRQLAPTSQLDAELQAAFGDLNPPLRGGEAPPQGGLGMTPEAGAMPAPEQMMAPPAMEEVPAMADGGMVPPYASGSGLDGIPVADTMFDENRNGGYDDGYASGGLVAFARGGMANLYDDVEYWESGGRHGAVSPKGARGVMQLMPGTARDPGYGIAPARDGSEAENRRVGRQYLDAMYREFNGDQKLALMAYNWGPGAVRNWLKSGADPKKVPTETRNYVANILGNKASPKLDQLDMDNRDQRQRVSLEESIGLAGDLLGDMPTKRRREMEAYYENELSPEAKEKSRKEDMWATLGQLGATLASTSGPFLAAVGESIAKTLPGAVEDRKERKAAEREAMKMLGEIENLDRQDRKDIIKLGQDLWSTDLTAQQKQDALAAEIEQRTLDREAQLATAAANRDTQLQVAAMGLQKTGNDQFSRATANWYNILKDKAARGEQIKTPDGKVVVPYLNGQRAPGAKIADHELQRLAMEFAANTLKSMRAGQQVDPTMAYIQALAAQNGAQGGANTGAGVYEGFSAVEE